MIRQAMYALAVVGVSLVGCMQPTTSQPSAGLVATTLPSPLKAAFDAKGLLDEQDSVLVQAMVEDGPSVHLRARSTGLDPAVVGPKAYGLRIYVVHKDAEVGTAFFSRTQIYHLDSIPDQIIVDRRYVYGMGFLTPDVIKVKDKTWSERYSASAAEMNQLDVLAEAVQGGWGMKEAYDATGLFGPLAKSGADEENSFEREVTWLVGPQSLEGIYLSVKQSAKFGNRLNPVFIEAP